MKPDASSAMTVYIKALISTLSFVASLCYNTMYKLFDKLQLATYKSKVHVYSTHNSIFNNTILSRLVMDKSSLSNIKTFF